MTGSVIVTGAGSGIGRRLAELLLARRETVVALDLTFADAAREALTAAGPGRGHLVTADVRDSAAVEAAVAEGVAALGAPRLVVNCAGVLVATPFTETTEADFRRVVEVNLFGSRNVAAATLPRLGPGGHLVLTASLAGMVANYGYSAYCASKFAVVGLAEVLRLEQKPRGVRVSVVAPPEVLTPMVEEERRSGSPITGQMKQFAGSMALDPAARAVLAGIDKGGFLIVPTARARAVRVLNRVAPSALTHAISDRLLTRLTRNATGPVS